MSLKVPSRLFCVASAILVAAGCGRHQPPPPPPPFVGTTVAAFGTIAPSQSLAGIIAPYENVAIQSSLVEPADAVNVQEGDVVRKGQVLAQLDTADLQAQLQSDTATADSNRANTSHAVFQGSLTIAQGVDALKSDQAAVGQAQQTLTNDRQNLDRDTNLLKQGYVSQQSVDQQSTTVRNDEHALDAAEATLAGARSNVQANGSLSGSGLQAAAVQQSQAQEDVAIAQARQVQVSIAKATIYSPIDGVVVNRNINPGEYPGNRQIFTIQQTDPVYAVLHGSSAQVADIKPGAPATVVASDVHATHLSGAVVGVLNQVVPGSTDFIVKVLLQNPGHRLRSGTAVQGRVALPVLRGVRVPETAFIDDNHDTLLTVGLDGTVKTVKVSEVGSDGLTSVIAGIPSGTRIVSNGQSSVGDGEKVSYRQ
ncbi:MAG TPA: efflux RND transporter periplasmic adaptor subunit [Candidatus Tumulicola sp.]|jgi:multidrug efflux pump subunit AcrA (membrane-fusion protein)